MATVHIKNIEPVWAAYYYEVDVPDGLSDAETEGRALGKLLSDEKEDDKDVRLLDNHDIEGSIEGLDQEYEPYHIDRGDAGGLYAGRPHQVYGERPA